MTLQSVVGWCGGSKTRVLLFDHLSSCSLSLSVCVLYLVSCGSFLSFFVCISLFLSLRSSPQIRRPPQTGRQAAGRGVLHQRRCVRGAQVGGWVVEVGGGGGWWNCGRGKQTKQTSSSRAWLRRLTVQVCGDLVDASLLQMQRKTQPNGQQYTECARAVSGSYFLLH